jgi:hypothetical protein
MRRLYVVLKMNRFKSRSTVNAWGAAAAAAGTSRRIEMEETSPTPGSAITVKMCLNLSPYYACGRLCDHEMLSLRDEITTVT